MKKELREKLVKYASAAAAVSGVAGVNAQIVYTDVTDLTIDDDHNANGFSLVGLDLNNDMTYDFILGSRDTSYLYQGTTPVDLKWSLAAPYSSGNAIAIDSSSYALALNNGNNIDNTLNWSTGTNSARMNIWINVASGANSYSYGNWNGVTDKYLGLRFQAGGSTYYGWVRLDVGGTTSADVFTVKDYAYNSTADAAINAGDMGTAGLADADLDALVHFINQANNTVLVKVNGELTNGVVNVVSTSGQLVQTGKVDNGTFVVNMNGLTAGVYMINVTFEEGAITKKMYVH